MALGYPQHMTAAGARCAWNPDRVTRGGYDFGGWGEWSKSNPCHLRVYGEPNLNNEPLTLKKSTGWWDRVRVRVLGLGLGLGLGLWSGFSALTLKSSTGW